MHFLLLPGQFPEVWYVVHWHDGWQYNDRFWVFGAYTATSSILQVAQVHCPHNASDNTPCLEVGVDPKWVRCHYVAHHGTFDSRHGLHSGWVVYVKAL